MKKIYFLLSFFFLSFMIHAQNPDAFIITVEVGDNPDLEITGLDFILPVVSNINNNYTVDFGDGTILTNQTGHVTHIYTTSGIYTVSLTGTFKHILFGNESFPQSNANKLQSVEQW